MSSLEAHDRAGRSGLRGRAVVLTGRGRGTAIAECVRLAVACLITYWLVTSAVSRVY